MTLKEKARAYAENRVSEAVSQHPFPPSVPISLRNEMIGVQIITFEEVFIDGYNLAKEEHQTREVMEYIKVLQPNTRQRYFDSLVAKWGSVEVVYEMMKKEAFASFESEWRQKSDLEFQKTLGDRVCKVEGCQGLRCVNSEYCFGHLDIDISE